MITLTLKQQLQIIDWLKTHAAEISGTTQADICDRIRADTGITLKVWALRRINKEAGLPDLPGRNSKRLPKAVDRHAELAFLAKLIRDIGTQLGCLSDGQVADLTTIVSRRSIDRETS